MDDDVIHMAQRAYKRVRKRSAQVRLRFISRRAKSDAKPPLARMLKGGQGGASKLKVHLSLLWFGAGGDHEVTLPAHSYARLLGFEDPYGKGARRVRDAIKWLEDANLVSVRRRPGWDPVVTLLREDASGSPYEVPGSAAKDPINKRAHAFNHYLKLPPGFWTQGWAAFLDAPAIAMLLVLLAKAQGRRAHDLWISPTQLEDWYDFSDDTRRRGARALEEAGLILIGRAPVDPDYERRRTRNIYSIEPELLNHPIDPEAKHRWAADIALHGSARKAWVNYVNERLSTSADQQHETPVESVPSPGTASSADAPPF